MSFELEHIAVQELEADRLTKSDGGVLIQPVVKKAKVSWRMFHTKLVILCKLTRLHCHRFRLDYCYQCFLFALRLIFLGQKVNRRGWKSAQKCSLQGQNKLCGSVRCLTLPKLD